MNTATQTKLGGKEGNLISGSQLKKLVGCAKAYAFSEMGMSISGTERRDFLMRAVYHMAQLLMQGVPDIENGIDQFFADYKAEWFGSTAEYENARAMDIKKVSRMAEYILQNGYTVKEIHGEYSSWFNGEKTLTVNGQPLSGICGNHTLVLEKDRKYTLVNIFLSKPKYSLQARKEERMPENSPELICSYIGGFINYGKNFSCELWYLTNVNDSGHNMPEFNNRPGKNIIFSETLDSMNPTEIFNAFLRVSKMQIATECSSCVYKDACIQAPFRKDDVLEENTSSSASKQEIRFTKAQQQVVEHVNGPMCCIAVPGAGKTTALVSRMKRLVEKGVRPDKILMLTFTKKAAQEISDRIFQLLGAVKTQPTIATYNALGFSILKENPIYAGGKRLKLADDIDRYRLIYAALKENPMIKGVSYNFIEGEHGLIRMLDNLFQEIDQKGESLFKSIYQETKDVDGILQVYNQYKEDYAKNGFISFDQQISMVNELFENYDELLHRCSNKYEYIMVDEFQDTSADQAEMIYALAREHNNLVVVGDDDQSIYTWRGGTPEFMLNFKKDFPDAEIVYMEDNFRSNQAILTAANAVIAGNAGRYQKQIQGHCAGGTKPLYVKGVPADIVGLVDEAVKQDIALGDIAILARNNRQLLEVQDLLEKKYPVAVPKDYMIEDAGFIAIFDMLSLYYDGLDNDVSFYRLLCTLGAQRCFAKKQSEESLYASLVRTGRLLPIKKTAECLERYYAKAQESDCMKAGYVILQCFEKIAYDNLNDAVTFIIQNIFQVKSHRIIDALCEKAEERGIVKTKALYNLMHDMIKYGVEARVGYGVSNNAINLLTCHDAKGKEFHTVILYGMEMFEDNSDDEESIRLLYVAMTRAKQRLYLLENAMPRTTELTDKMRSYLQVVSTR